MTMLYFKISTDGAIGNDNFNILIGKGGRMTPHFKGILKVYSKIMLF